MICRANTSFDEAIDVLRGLACPLGIESTRLAKAGWRVLAEAVHARVDAPRHNAAAMDGFAIQMEGPIASNYEVVGASFPGQPWLGEIRGGQAVRIMTGAAVPAGADRVVPLERTDIDGSVVRFPEGLPARDHVRQRGTDMKCGQVVLGPGTLLTPRALLVAAAADVSTVRTWRRPVVSVIASGDELAPPGSAAEIEGAIPDSLSEALLLLARQYDAKAGKAALVPDDNDAISTSAADLLRDCDVLLLVGGASRGDRDFAKAGLEPLGLEICFADVAMKPGKPVWYGRIGNRHVLGLPGNPTAAMTTARLFFVPLVRALGGRDFDGGLRWQPLPLVQKTDPVAQFESFFCGSLKGLGVEVIERQAASAQRMLAHADVLVRMPVGEPARSIGDLVKTLRF